MKTLNGKRRPLRAAPESSRGQSKGSAELYERSRRLMPGGVTSNIRYADPHPLYVRDARGARIWDIDGHEYVDCRLGFGPVILGHAPEAITASVMRALMNGTVYALPHAGEAELAEKVIESVPGAEMTSVLQLGLERRRSTPSVSARAYTGRKKIAKFEGRLPRHPRHGDDERAVQAGRRGARRGRPLPRWSRPASRGDRRQHDGAAVQPLRRPSTSSRPTPTSWPRSIVEPVQGSGRVDPGYPGFLAALRAVTARHGVVSSSTRSSPGSGSRWAGRRSTTASEPTWRRSARSSAGAFRSAPSRGRASSCGSCRCPTPREAGRTPVAYGGTFNGNPTSVAAANATLDFLREHRDLYQTLNAQGDRIRREVPAKAAALGIPLSACGLGSLFAFRFVDGAGDECPGRRRRGSGPASGPVPLPAERGGAHPSPSQLPVERARRRRDRRGSCRVTTASLREIQAAA